MRPVLQQRRPSASMVVALIALVMGASGTAIAASKLISGDKLIRKHSLSGNRLRNHTITRRQINFSKLGTVPSANTANFATAAGNAATANSATTLDGFPPSTFEPSAYTVRTGLVQADAGNSVTLASFGPFTLTLSCTESGTSFDAQVTVSATSPNPEVDGSMLSGPTTLVDTGMSPSFATNKKVGVDFISYGNGSPGDRFEFFGDVVALAHYAGFYGGRPCSATALIRSS